MEHSGIHFLLFGGSKGGIGELPACLLKRSQPGRRGGVQEEGDLADVIPGIEFILAGRCGRFRSRDGISKQWLGEYVGRPDGRPGGIQQITHEGFPKIPDEGLHFRKLQGPVRNRDDIPVRRAFQEANQVIYRGLPAEFKDFMAQGVVKKGGSFFACQKNIWFQKKPLVVIPGGWHPGSSFGGT